MLGGTYLLPGENDIVTGGNTLLLGGNDIIAGGSYSLIGGSELRVLRNRNGLALGKLNISLIAEGSGKTYKAQAGNQ